MVLIPDLLLIMNLASHILIDWMNMIEFLIDIMLKCFVIIFAVLFSYFLLIIKAIPKPYG